LASYRNRHKLGCTVYKFYSRFTDLTAHYTSPQTYKMHKLKPDNLSSLATEVVAIETSVDAKIE